MEIPRNVIQAYPNAVNFFQILISDSIFTNLWKLSGNLSRRIIDSSAFQRIGYAVFLLNFQVNMEIYLDSLFKLRYQRTEQNVISYRCLAYCSELSILSADSIRSILRNQSSTCLDCISLNAVHNFPYSKVCVFRNRSFQNVCQKILSMKKTFGRLVISFLSLTGFHQDPCLFFCTHFFLLLYIYSENWFSMYIIT